MKNKKVKQMMVDVADFKYGVPGLSRAEERGFHGFSDSGVFYSIGGNFIWFYSGCVVSITSDHYN